MAADLASTPSTGVRVQCCGDAHLSNFGGFATPERKIIFAINDLDETLPAPWEWDLKRLAASFIVACRDNGVSDSTAKDVATTCARTYRESTTEFSSMKMLELWYYALGPDELMGMTHMDIRKRVMNRIEQERAKSTAEEIYPKLVEHKGDKPVIKDQPPTIFHAKGHTPGEVPQEFKDAFRGYRNTLSPSYQSLLDRYEIKDAAIKVVGIGSVGTVCWVALLMAGEGDPLFLQIKQARTSVLEPYAGASEFSTHGQRVVHGYRLMPQLNGLDAGEQLKKELPKVKLLYVSMHFDADIAAEAFRRGGSGYLPKTSGLSELRTAVHKVLRGETYLSPLIARRSINGLLKDARAAVEEDQHLSLRQKQVLQLLVEGKQFKEVAHELNIAPRTVAFHKYRIMGLLKVNNNADLVRYALRKRMAGRKSGDKVLSVSFVPAEYGRNIGKEVALGKGCAKGSCNVAPAFARPVLIRNNENGVPVIDPADAWPVGRE